GQAPAPSLVALWLAIGEPNSESQKQKMAAAKAQALAPVPIKGSTPSMVSRVGYAEGWARQGSIDKGRDLAWSKEGKSEDRLRAGAAVAAVVLESRSSDVADLDKCAAMLDSELKDSDFDGSWLLYRLVKLCERADRPDLAAKFAGAIRDPG